MSLLLAALLIPELAVAEVPVAVATCENVPPGANQYKLATGFSTARANTPKAKDEAMAKARADARLRLETDLCSAMPNECSRYNGYVTEWQVPGVYNDKTRVACATAVIELRLLNPDRQRADAETQITKLGSTLAKRLVDAKVSAVRLADPHRSDGCALPELEPVRMWVRARLGEAGIAVLADDAAADATEVDMSASVAGGQLTLAAVATLGDGSQVTTDPISFLASAYDVPATGGKCVGSSKLGLDTRGQKRGTVNLDMKVPTRGGGLCVGQPIEPVLTVDRPTQVHVYSVDSSGAAYHVWPYEGSDRVEGSVSLGVSWASPNARADDETLVAIAIPDGGSLGPIVAHMGFCRLTTPMSAALYPRDATVVSQTWHVITDPNACGAPPAEVPTAAELEQVLNSAPPCR